jgi:hypothetical protein
MFRLILRHHQALSLRYSSLIQFLKMHYGIPKAYNFFYYDTVYIYIYRFHQFCYRDRVHSSCIFLKIESPAPPLSLSFKFLTLILKQLINSWQALSFWNSCIQDNIYLSICCLFRSFKKSSHSHMMHSLWPSLTSRFAKRWSYFYTYVR